jgi:hypothetical protein
MEGQGGVEAHEVDDQKNSFEPMNEPLRQLVGRVDQNAGERFSAPRHVQNEQP